MAYTDAQKALAVQFIRRSGGHLNDETIAGVRDLLSAPGLSRASLFAWLKQPAIPSSESESRIQIGQEKRKLDSGLEPGGARSEQQTGISVAALQAADATLDSLFDRILRTYAARALEEDAVNATKGKDAVTAAATALDKLRLIRGLPTAIVAVLPAILTELEESNIDATEFFNAVLAKARAARMKNANG